MESDLVANAIAQYNHNLEIETGERIGPDSVLFGDNGILDSIAILELISLVESGISTTTGRDILLLDRYSEYTETVDKMPFKNAESLGRYVRWVLAAEA